MSSDFSPHRCKCTVLIIVSCSWREQPGKERLRRTPPAVCARRDYRLRCFLYTSVTYFNEYSITLKFFRGELHFVIQRELLQRAGRVGRVDRPGACEVNWGRLLFYWPVSSSSPFIHLMEAAGLLPMAVQVSSVSFPSLTTSSRLSMIGLPGGTDPRQRWRSEKHQQGSI